MEFLLKKDQDEVTVKESLETEGTVVVRDGMEYTLSQGVEDVLIKYQEQGWERYSNGMPATIDAKLEDFLIKHKEMSALKKKADKLKEEIRTYMENNKLEDLSNDFGEVYLQEKKKSNSSSVFTDYVLGSDLTDLLTGAGVYQQVVELRVNSTKLDGLLKAGNIDPEFAERIRKEKVEIPANPAFTVRR